MFNLLPPTEKKVLRLEYRMRVIIVTLWLTLVTLIIASVLLIPSLLLSSQKEDVAQHRLETLKKNMEKEGVAELNKVLLDAQATLTLLRHESPKVLFYQVLLDIASVKTDDISISSFSFAETGKERHQVGISGIAKDRFALVAFVKALQHTGWFEKVEAPISDFAKDADIEFGIQVIGLF